MELVGYGSCVTIPHAANTPTGEPEVCNQQAATTDAATAKYYTFPPPEYTTGFEEITIFGGAAVVGHGNHMATVEDNAGPGTCTLAPGSPAPQGPPWLGCMQQFLGVVTGAGWTDHNCTCGPWTAMSSPVMITYDGKVYGNEVMPMVALADAGAIALGGFEEAEEYKARLVVSVFDMDDELVPLGEWRGFAATQVNTVRVDRP